mgnify:CR=1 FL=1
MYVKVNEEGNAVEYTVQELKKDNSQVSFPLEISVSLLAEYNVYSVVEQAKPDYNRRTHTINYTFINVENEWQKQWIITEKSVELIRESYQEQVTLHRWEKETAGVNWVDSASETWFIATDLDSQGRLTSVVTAVQQGLRADNGVWKCTNSSGEIVYRPTTNAEVIQIGTLVHSHVQKCFTAEANMMAKVLAQDYTSSFEDEFNNL